MVRMEKVLERKRHELTLLELLNRQAESLRSQGQPFQDKFQARYAGAVLRLEELNHLVRDKLLNVRALLQDGSVSVSRFVPKCGLYQMLDHKDTLKLRRLVGLVYSHDLSVLFLSLLVTDN